MPPFPGSSEFEVQIGFVSDVGFQESQGFQIYWSSNGSVILSSNPILALSKFFENRFLFGDCQSPKFVPYFFQR
jgi:hypothetical protein